MYGEMMDEMDVWADKLELEYVNGELQIIAADERSKEIDMEWEEMMFDRFTCTEFEASQYSEEY